MAKRVGLGREWRWGKGVFFCSLLIEDVPLISGRWRKSEDPSQGGNTGAVARASDHLGLVQARLERARAETAAGAGGGR